MTPKQRSRRWLSWVDRPWDTGLAAAMSVPAASRFGLIWLPLTALLLAGLVLLSPLHQRLAGSLHDASLRAVARPAHYGEVLVVDIDDASLRALRPRLGAWPYTRDTFALVIAYLRELGAKVIVLDIVLAETRDRDAALAKTLAERGDVVLAAAALKRSADADADADASPEVLRRRLSVAVDPTQPATRWAAVTLPAERLLTALVARSGPGAVGIISTPLDADGLLRRLPLLHEVDGRVYPSMALAPHLLAPPRPGVLLERVEGELRLGNWRWPIDDHGEITVVLPSNRDAVPSLPFSTLMAAALGMSEGAGLREAVTGRTVFVGSSAFLADDVMTPLGPVSGSVMLATAHAALARGEVLDRSVPALGTVLAGIALAPSLWIWLRRRPVLAHDAWASLLALLSVLVIGLGVLALLRIELGLTFPLAITVAGFMLSALLQLRWIGLANRQLSVDRAMAEAANQAKTDFLANVSHEIRTPMNALLGVAELLQRTPLNLEQQRYVEVFQRSGQTLFELINDLLDLSKIEAGHLALQPAPFLLRRLLTDQHNLLSAKAVGKGLVLDWQLADDLPDTVVGDRRRLAQVLTNLVGNAIKFTPAGRVEVSVSNLPEGISFSVRDTGVGVADDQQVRIFQPFVQADGSPTRVHGGTGLGLSIARSLVEQMGGRISMRSEAGAGSVFSFIVPLPVTDQAPEALDQPAGVTQLVGLAQPPAAVWPPTAHDEAQIRPSAGSPFRVLLTEDNEVNVLMVEAMLRDSGIEIDVANDGEAAVALFRRGGHDLVLMDVQMPGIDGHAATREIRCIEAREGRRPIPVIALTAHAFDRDVQRSIEAGCNAHLTKPIARESLLAAINAFRTPDSPSVRSAGRSDPLSPAQ